MAASFFGEGEKVDYLLSKGANVELKDIVGASVLCHASTERVVRSLITAGAKVDKKVDKKKENIHPLIAMVHRKHAEGIEAHVKAWGADVNMLDLSGMTPLHICATMIGSEEIVEKLVELGANMESFTFQQCSPLTLAAVNNNKGVVKTLAKLGADLDPEWVDEKTLLDALLVSDRWETVKLLLQLGAKPKNRVNFLRQAVFHGATEIVELLMDGMELKGTGVLYFASKPYMLKLLLQKGADPNEVFPPGGPPLLHVKVEVELIKPLLSAKVDVNSRFRGRSAIHAIALNSNPGVITELVKAGADVNEKDDNGLTPLHYVRKAAIAKELMEGGAKIMVENKRALSPLHTAVQIVDVELEVIDILVKGGNDVNAKNSSGLTPLFVVTTAEQVKRLVGLGANVNASTRNGHTPIHTAVSRLNEQVFNELIKRSAKAEATTTTGHNLLHTLAIRDKDKSPPELYSNFIRKIMKLGIHLNAKTSLNVTPLGMAMESGNQICADALRQFKAQ